jgi:hypothetical protein
MLMPLLLDGAAAGQEKTATTQPVLKHSEIVFMYAADSQAYREYRATFVGWGGANTAAEVKRHRDLGIRCTGSMWCLTAGAKALHDDPNLLAATAVDIEGKPIEVPWLFDHTYQGTKSYFGCTNHPAFRDHLRQKVREAMAGGADGLHIDDHLGVAQAALNFGGGLCDCCMAAFREYLKKNVPPEELQQAGAGDIGKFDYRDIVRKYAKTRQEYLKARDKIPLMKHFRQFHLEAAAKNVQELGKLASEVAKHPVLLSANACVENEQHRYVVPYLTHVICEVWHNAPSGTAKLSGAILAYEFAARAGRPLAATASGGDWAYVKATGCEDLARFWIALAYAHGQRFMAPHPKRQWCFTNELGTHWYEAPIASYAPVYQFISANADCFDGFEAAKADGVEAPKDVICLVRQGDAKTGVTVLHVLNKDYDQTSKSFRAKENVQIRLPSSLFDKPPVKARSLAYDGPEQAAPVKVEGRKVILELPKLRLWTVVVLK